MSGEGTGMVERWLRRSEEREEKAIQWSLEESNRRVREERRQAEEDQSEEMEISESDSSGCDEHYQTISLITYLSISTYLITLLLS